MVSGRTEAIAEQSELTGSAENETADDETSVVLNNTHCCDD